MLPGWVLGVGRYMTIQIIGHIRICIDNREHLLLVDFILQPCGCHGHNAFGVKLIGIEKISGQGLGIIGFV
jgi:hypothetical protein